MSRSYKFVVFDFDGVVCDSTNECMVTSWNAWNRWNNRSEFRRSLNEFDQLEIDLFRPLRPYVRGAGEYYIIMKVINGKNKKINNQNDFDNFRNKWESNLISFKKTFLTERNRLRNEDLKSWINLHEVYNDVINFMKKINEQGRLLIATLKDADSVQLILRDNGLDIQLDDILDQSKISSKLQALDNIVLKKNISKEELCFLDDNVTHLLQPHENKYKVFLTGWGNTMKEHKKKAIENNIPIINKIKDGVF